MPCHGGETDPIKSINPVLYKSCYNKSFRNWTIKLNLLFVCQYFRSQIEQIIFNSKTNYYTVNIFFVLEMKHCSDKLLIYLNSSVKFTRSRLFLVTYLSTRLLSAFVTTLPLWCFYFHYPYLRHGLFMNEIKVSWLGKDICNSMRFSF